MCKFFLEKLFLKWREQHLKKNLKSISSTKSHKDNNLRSLDFFPYRTERNLLHFSKSGCNKNKLQPNAFPFTPEWKLYYTH